jgi:predicted RNA-binding Zn-ribbon protein involved in translation (DUF1610 family)
MSPNAAINHAAQTNFKFRWLHAAVWGLYALVYFSWLFAPIMPGRERDSGSWWFPDVFVRYAFSGMTGGDSLNMGDQSLDGVLGAERKLLVNWGEPNWIYFPIVFLLLAVLGGSGWMFLFSGSNVSSRLPARRKFSLFTVIACALMFALLTVGLVSGTLEHLEYWVWFLDLPYMLANNRFTWSASQWAEQASMFPASILLVGAWMAWTSILWVFRKRKQRYWQFERITLWMMIPAMILLFTPWLLDMLNWQPLIKSWRNVPDGLYTTRVFAATVLLWAWGCRVILLFQLERYRMQTIDNPDQICFACGYDLRGTISADRHQCPECGAAVTVLDQENEAASQ